MKFNFKKIVILLLILLFIVVIEGVISYIIYNEEKNRDNDKAIKVIEKLQVNFETELSSIFNTISYVTRLGDNILNSKDIRNITLPFFIDFMKLEQLKLSENLDEFRLVPIINSSDRSNYEAFASEHIKTNFTIKDAIFSNEGTVFVPSEERPFYCPLSLLSPNSTPELFEFVGIDLCNTFTWGTFIEEMNNINSSKNVIRDRFVVRTQTLIIDLGHKYKNSYSIISFFVEEFFKEILKTTMNAELKIDVGLKVVDVNSNRSIYDETLSSTNFERDFLFDTNADKLWHITLFYSNNLVESFEDDSEITMLIIIVSTFISIDLCIIILFVIWKKHKQDQKEKIARSRELLASQMINYVNHEVRNPLNSTMGLLQFIKLELEYKKIDEIDRASLVSNIDTAFKSCELIRHIVNDILDMRKLEERKLQINYSLINLNDFIASFLKLIKPKIEENRNIEFLIENNIEEIETDPNRLLQLILNIVGNSFKFTDSGQIKLIINQIPNNKVRFEIHDSGRGIPVDKKDGIFQPFYQTNANQGRYGGYGLGLYLCKMLIEALHGEIGFESESGKGTMFWFEIPNNSDHVIIPLN